FRWLRRPLLCRNAEDDRRRDGALAGGGRKRRLQYHVPVSAGRSRRLRRSRGSGATAARDLPARVRGAHAAREPRPAASAEQIFCGLIASSAANVTNCIINIAEALR